MILLLHTTIPDPQEQQSECIRLVFYNTLGEIPHLHLSAVPSTLNASAARKIQTAYRCHMKQRRVVRKGIDATHAHYWDLLRERSTEIEWPKDSQYCLLFRAPLADILVCLDVIKAFAESKEANKRMRTASHKDPERLMEAGNQYRCDTVGCILLTLVA